MVNGVFWCLVGVLVSPSCHCKVLARFRLIWKSLHVLPHLASTHNPGSTVHGYRFRTRGHEWLARLHSAFHIEWVHVFDKVAGFTLGIWFAYNLLLGLRDLWSFFCLAFKLNILICGFWILILLRRWVGFGVGVPSSTTILATVELASGVPCPISKMTAEASFFLHLSQHMNETYRSNGCNK